MTYNDAHSLELLRATAGGLLYRAPSYTCIKEFTNNFPVPEPTAFTSELRATESAWQPEAPIPRLYTKNYRKSILSTLKQPIAKT